MMTLLLATCPAMAARAVAQAAVPMSRTAVPMSRAMPTVIVPSRALMRMAMPGPTFKSGDWTCAECGASPVFASRTTCFKCGAARPAGAGNVRPPGGGRGRDGGRGGDRGGGSKEFRTNFVGTRCFVENLSFDTDWRSLKDAFYDEGYPIVYASVSEDRETGRSKGHGIVQFETEHAAKHAIEQVQAIEMPFALLSSSSSSRVCPSLCVCFADDRFRARRSDDQRA